MSIHVTRAPTVPLTSYDTKRSSHLKEGPIYIYLLFQFSFANVLQKYRSGSGILAEE